MQHDCLFPYAWVLKFARFYFLNFGSTINSLKKIFILILIERKNLNLGFLCYFFEKKLDLNSNIFAWVSSNDLMLNSTLISRLCKSRYRVNSYLEIFKFNTSSPAQL